MQIRKTLPLALSFNVCRLDTSLPFPKEVVNKARWLQADLGAIFEKLRCASSEALRKRPMETDLLRYDTRAVFRLSSRDRAARLLNIVGGLHALIPGTETF